jgi:hypothetical protein
MKDMWWFERIRNVSDYNNDKLAVKIYEVFSKLLF